MSQPEPTAVELAAIAALLAKSSGDSPAELSKRAFEIWSACEGLLEGRRIHRERMEEEWRNSGEGEEEPDEVWFERRKAQFLTGIARPKKYPLDFDGLLRLVMPKDSKAIRWKAYRDFLKARRSAQNVIDTMGTIVIENED